MSTAAILVFIGLVSFWFVYIWQPLRRWTYRKIPGDRYPWLFFNPFAFYIMDQKTDTGIEIVDRYPKMCLKPGPNNDIFLCEPSLIKKAAIVNEWKAGDFRTAMAATKLTNGFETFSIVEATGNYWYDLRSLLSPAFTLGTIKSYDKAINECIDDHINLTLSSACKTESPINILDFTKSLTLQIIVKAAFGADLDLNKKEDAEDLQALADASMNMFHTMMKTWGMPIVFMTPDFLRPYLRFWPFAVQQIGLISQVWLEPGRLAYEILTRTFNQEFTSLEKREKLSSKINQEEDQDDILNSKNAKSPALKNFQDWQKFRAPGLLKMLMDNGLVDGKPMSLLEIQIQLTIIILAGHDTTALTLAFTLWELARNPQYRQKVFEEIDKFGRDKQISVDDMSKFPYIKACLQESLRKYPIVKYLTRKCTADNFKLDEYDIPKGSNFIFPLRGMHLSSRFWPKPFEWRPERWLGDSTYCCQSQTLAHFPFGYGSRICIGYQLANAEQVLSTVKIFQKYDLEIVGSQDLGVHYLGLGAIEPNEPMNMKVVQRQ